MKIVFNPKKIFNYFGRNLRSRFFPLASNKLNRELIANIFINGNGIEIGALDKPLKVPKNAKIKYVDRMPENDLSYQYHLKSKDLIKIDIIDDGEQLKTISDDSVDFVIANHFLEHCQNPVLAVKNMLRVLKKDGILYLSVPDKNFTFDRDREITTLEHILRDFEEGPDWSRNKHFEEWVKQVDKVKDDNEAEKRLTFLMNIDYSIHFHVWTQFEINEMFILLKKRLNFPFILKLVFNNEIENIFILKKL